MLLLLLFLICGIIFMVVSKLLDDNCFDCTSVISSIIGVLFCGAFVFFGIVAIISNIDVEATIAKKYQTYEALTYQVEHFNELYENSAANDKKELMDDIKEWNENVASGRVSYNNKWVNWFNPIDYNQFEYIEMPKFEEKVS